MATRKMVSKCKVTRCFCPPAGCACVGRPGGELCAAAGAAECVCRGDAGAALPAAPLLSPLLHWGTALLQVCAPRGTCPIPSVCKPTAHAAKVRDSVP